MFLPDNIDLGKPEKYVLSIRIKPDGFSFLIYDPNDKTVFCFQETEFSKEISLLNNIQRIIFDFNFLTENYRQTNVVFAYPDYELLPGAFYEKQHVKTFYDFTHGKDTDYILTSEYPIEGCKLIFGIDDELRLFLKRSLCNPSFFHHNGLQINYFREKAAPFNGNTMSVYFHEDFVDLNCFDAGNNILFAHTYYKEHHQDIIFYLLSIWEKSSFNQLDDQLIVFGYYPDSQIEETLKNYIKSIKNIGLYDPLVDFGEKVQHIPLDLLILTK
ncbi:DUF3822 family protein [Viscerimonas tarda]